MRSKEQGKAGAKRSRRKRLPQAARNSRKRHAEAKASALTDPIVLNEKDFEAFTAAIENPAPPNEALRALFRRAE